MPVLIEQNLSAAILPFPSAEIRCPAYQPHRVVLIPGDGIGPEVAEATARVVEATGISVEWERVELNAKTITEHGGLLPKTVLDALGRIRVALKGPVGTPIGGGFRSVNLALRKKLNLFANFRPVRSMPGLTTRYSDVCIDLVIFRENTESLYSGLEHKVAPGVVESLKVITRKASLRIAKSAFVFARREGRHRVTAIHKANILKLSDGLFLRCCRRVARDYPEIQYDELIVDNTAMQLVTRPETLDVLLTPNLYGDILSDLAAGLVGGLGIVPGANLGETHAVFEAVHGSAPDIAGKGIANPTGLMQSAVLLLSHLGERAAAERLHAAIRKVYATRRSLTPDVGGSASTSEFTDAVVHNLEVSAGE
jgi:isocitrate dehydrogenase (NAD+)